MVSPASKEEFVDSFKAALGRYREGKVHQPLMEELP
jgi:hypothetical protein